MGHPSRWPTSSATRSEIRAADAGPDAGKTVTFVESSDGALPKTGSLAQLAFCIADMNGDGFQDIIAPSRAAGRERFPAIFLGDGKGTLEASGR